ncbi:Helicase protein MOM1 [Spatholobus suberectus]|nr:Helicase protein MOM1 [Spatholobus suberectus]
MNAETLVVDEDGGDACSRCNEGLTEYKDNAQANPHMKDKKGGGEVVCSNCMRGGVLLCCCGKGCQRRYHPSCVDPPLNYIPLGFWHCIWCIKKKIELGVHSVSEGVKSILDSREVVSNNRVMQREYFVKYQGLAHAHNRWIPESKMLLEAPKLLAKFKRELQMPNYQVTRWKRDWSIPHRLLLKREIILSKQNDQHFDGHGDNDSICRYEWLVKWTGLGYDNITWELDDASFLTAPEGMKLIDDYERRCKRADRLSKNHFEANEERKASFAELSELPSGDSPGYDNQHLSYVNKLRMCWHKGQSAVIVDDHIDQERVMKVILFILSLNCNVKRPFLIISTSTALSVWEAEFLHLAPSANLVVYKGNRDVRSGIRALEFFNEDDGILFQILLSSADIIVEDLHALRCIPWEAIIIDECQRSRILGQLDNIKILKAEMRLLLVNGQIKEDRADYIKLLSFLKSGHHGSNIAQMETYFSDSISTLKSQLEKYVVFKCKSGSTRFVEYWVPACLSNLQLEQYCSMLLSNLMLLCSGQKSASVDTLHDLIISMRKCCDHPYLVNPTLHGFVTKGLPVEKHLDIEIKASGKLQLLEKILLEARSRGLRVLIVFQSTCGSRSIGNILDDVLCQRFGKDCYVRYDRGYTPKTKQAALDTFNDKESGKFVFLMDNRACLSSVKLSSVDTVILFDSDLDPQNDLRGLQRMSISSQFKQFTVFRLYTYFTVEEKVLMLAKEGIALDINARLISQSTYHTLLKWGTCYLFNKLDDLHASATFVSDPDIADQSILPDVICELSSQLACSADDTDCHGWSFISRIQQNGGEYARSILLLGERIMKKLGSEPCSFSWSDLEGRHPRWKFLSVSSQRIRKTVRHFDHILKESECENDTFIGKRTASEDNVDPNRLNVSKDNVDPRRREVSKDNFDPTWRKLTEDIVDPKRRKVSKDVVETNGRKVSNHAIDPKTRKVSNDIVCLKGRKMSKNIVDSKYRKTRLKSKKNPSVVNRASKSNGNSNGLSNVLDSTMHPLTNETTGATATNMQFSEKNKLLDIPNNIKFLPKPDISGLCDILHFSKNVKAVAVRILEHIFKHYNVNCQEVSTVQAFEISVCWLAASLLKHKIDRKDSLALAKLHLNFDCKEEEATDVYSELWKHEKDFSICLQSGLCVEKCNINCASDSEMPELNDLAEGNQKDFLGTCVSKLVKSVTNERDLQMKSPTTVVSQDQTCTHKICLSPKTPGSFPVEADAISMESGSEDDRMNAMTLITAEDSSLDPWSHDVNPVTGSLERQSPVRSTDITQSDGKVSEGPQILVNEVVAIDNAMNMSTHPVQLDSVETDAATCISTAVPEVRQWYSVMSPVCGESTAPEFAETTLPYMQPSHANLWSLPQMAMSAIPSFSEHRSANTVMPPDDIFYHSSEDHCYIDEAEVILEAPNDFVEPANSSFVSPVILQPFTSVLVNENTTHVPDSITIPGYVNSDYFQDHSVTSEMSHLAYPGPLLGDMERIENVNEAFTDRLLIEMESIENVNEEAFTDPLPVEMERIEKMNEEAFKIHEQKILQLQSDYKKEFEKLREKYRMLHQKVDTEVALKGMELETKCKLVLRNKVLAEVWIHNLDSCERAVVAQCTEQGMDHAYGSYIC